MEKRNLDATLVLPQEDRERTAEGATLNSSCRFPPKAKVAFPISDDTKCCLYLQSALQNFAQNVKKPTK